MARRAAAERTEVELEIRVTGGAPLYLAQQEAARRNQRRYNLISYALVFTLALFMFRSLAPVMIVGVAPASPSRSIVRPVPARP